MQLPKELTNGTYFYCNQYLLSTDGFKGFLVSFTAFLSVFFYFLWNKQHYKMNIAEGKKNLASDSASALITGLIGVFLSILNHYFTYLNGGIPCKFTTENLFTRGEPS
jgi:hypothetical protein